MRENGKAIAKKLMSFTYRCLKMSKSTKRSVAFFLVVLCGVGFLNCMSSTESQADQDSIERAEQREADFMQRQADYVAENGHGKHYSLKDGRVYD